MSEQPAPTDHVRQPLEPTVADAVRAYAARTRESAERHAAVLIEPAVYRVAGSTPLKH